jgi:hypothetical protein
VRHRFAVAAIAAVFMTGGAWVSGGSEEAPSAVALSYGTLLGGSGFDAITAMAVTSAGDVYVAGWTDSTDFPTLNPLQAASGGGVDAFVAKLNSSGALMYSTYVGGSGDDRAFGIAVDATGNAYVTGWTASPNFPVVGPIQAQSGGGKDAFVLKLNPTGNGLVFSTYFGGSGVDAANGLWVGADGGALVAGNTSSSDFPVREALQSAHAGFYDAFVAKLNPAGNGLVFSTYFGGSGSDSANAVGANAAGNAYLAGQTLSNNLPTKDGVQSINGGEFGGFVAVVASTPPCGGVGPQGVVTTATSGLLDFYVYNVPVGSAVYFPTWSVVNGEDDLLWYRGVDQGGGTWRGSVNLGYHRPGHPDYGEYTVHVWLFGAKNILCSSLGFTRTN